MRLTTPTLLSLLFLLPLTLMHAQSPSVDPSVEENYLNSHHQREWIRLGDDGSVSGSIKTLNSEGIAEPRPLAKILISLDGKPIQETTADELGNFKLENISPGSYALQCRGDQTIAAYAIHVLPASETHLETEVEVFACAISNSKAADLVQSNQIPVELLSSEDLYYRSFETDPIAQGRKSNPSHQILLEDGDLVGRVSRPGWKFEEQNLEGTIAKICIGDQVVATTAVDRDGYYRFVDLAPGTYNLLVTGDDGFAALAFEAIDATEIEPTNDGVLEDGSKLISTRLRKPCKRLCCELISQPEFNACSTCQPVAAAPACGCGTDPCGCGVTDPSIAGLEDPSLFTPGFGGGYAGGFGGGFGGGAGGGGGGIGGLGGAGGLLGIAGLAAGITALASDDDGFNANQATIVSP